MKNIVTASCGLVAVALSTLAPLSASAWAYGPGYGYSPGYNTMQYQYIQPVVQPSVYVSVNAGYNNYYMPPQQVYYPMPMYNSYPIYNSYSHPYYMLANNYQYAPMMYYGWGY